ncbi:choline dehydrogenase [Colletotrichum salicis]|uniref:Choline dehydrogenase n=1 Tax=Colletotrichum salicis TaxID=1209931 RepID=A0A135UNY6_9PEZI|nr:choline dehydrogenase [Colletotrichum salicis]
MELGSSSLIGTTETRNPEAIPIMRLTLDILVIAISVVQAAIFQNLVEKSLNISYDYVIVGGGTAGITLASRLSTGKSQFLSKQIININQGHKIGGSSAVNAMIFDRGMPSNYDAWAAHGDEGWDFAGLLPYFKKFSAGPGLTASKVEALKEVIVSAVALITPKLLQLSGIRPISLMSRHGIPSLVDLPGVGANLQDHPFGLTLASLSAGIPGNYELENATFDAEQKISTTLKEKVSSALKGREALLNQLLGRWADTIAEALAFIPLSNFTQSDVTGKWLSVISSAGAAQYLPQDTDQTIKDGYMMQVQQLLEMHHSGSTAGMELLYVDGGRSIVNILMHPLSRGTVAINSTDTFAPPVINPRYLSHRYDGQVLVESIRFNRKLLATEQIQALGATETLPGVGTTSDDDLSEFIKGVSPTEYHYAGTCAMLPRSIGGVVDSNLSVHGANGLRIVDASIMPLLPSAHTQAAVYAIAEKVNHAPTH